MTLSTWLAVITVALNILKTTPGVDPTILGYIQTALDAVIKATTAVEQAKQAVDPATLHQITPVP